MAIVWGVPNFRIFTVYWNCSLVYGTRLGWSEPKFRALQWFLGCGVVLRGGGGSIRRWYWVMFSAGESYQFGILFKLRQVPTVLAACRRRLNIECNPLNSLQTIYQIKWFLGLQWLWMHTKQTWNTAQELRFLSYFSLRTCFPSYS